MVKIDKNALIVVMASFLALAIVGFPQAHAASGIVNASGTTILYNASTANVKSVLLTVEFDTITAPQNEEFSLSIDGEATIIDSTLMPWAVHQVWITGSDNPVWTTSDCYKITVLKNYYESGGVTYCNTTRMIYSKFLWYFDQLELEYTLAVPVADDDLSVVLQDSTVENTTISTDWSIVVDNSVYLDVTGNEYNPSDIAVFIADLVNSITGAVAMLGLIMTWTGQLLPYVPLVAGFFIADALATGLFKGQWGPLGAITQTLVGIVVALVTAIASVIEAVNPL